MSGTSFNVNNNGIINGQQNIGQSGGKAVANVQPSELEVTIEQFLQSIEDSVREGGATPEEATELVQPLREVASVEPDQAEDPVTLKDRIVGLAMKLEPYAPTIRRTIAAFSEGVLRSLVGVTGPAGLVVAGLIEVMVDNRNS